MTMSQNRTASRGQAAAIGAPFLRRVTSLPDKWDGSRYPFDSPALLRGIDVTFRTPVTFFVGENGSGKSTLLEALAQCCAPIILAYPGAVLLSLDGDSIAEVNYRDSDHYRITRDFLNAPERYFRHLFEAPDDGDDQQ